MVPSLVFFFDAISDTALLTCLRDGVGDGDGYCEGREECEVRAGAFRKPRGSFRRLARRRTEPIVVISTLDVDSKCRIRTRHFMGFSIVENAHAPFRR